MWNLTLRLVLSAVVGVISAAVLNRLLPAFLVVSVLAALLAAVLAFFLASARLRKDERIAGTSFTNGFAVLSALLVFFATLFLLTFGPLNVDRSFSVWMLRNVAEQEQIPTESLKEQASAFFDPSSGEIERRISEQLTLGNVSLEDGPIELTLRGEMLVFMNELMARFFGLNPNYALGGE